MRTIRRLTILESLWSLWNLVRDHAWVILAALFAAGSVMKGFWNYIQLAAENEGWWVYPVVILVLIGAMIALTASLAWVWSVLRQQFGQARPAADQDFESNYVADPEAEALDKQAYNQLVAFCLDQLVPACDLQIDTQEALIRLICPNKIVGDFAIDGLRNDYRYKTREFWLHYTNLASGLTSSPGPTIKFEGMIDCIFELEREPYKNFCAQATVIAKSANIDLASDDTIAPIWTVWEDRHNKMVIAFEAIKRDIGFGKLHRLRPHRWGSPAAVPVTDEG